VTQLWITQVFEQIQLTVRADMRQKNGNRATLCGDKALSNGGRYAAAGPTRARSHQMTSAKVKRGASIMSEANLFSKGTHDAIDPMNQLLPLAYKELRRIARRALSRERMDHTLQPTALVHEAYLRLSEQSGVIPVSRSHFIALIAQMMRRILVNHALAKKTDKRGGKHVHIELSEMPELAVPNSTVDLVELNQALEELKEIAPEQGLIVELRFFGGLSIDEVAVCLDMSAASVKRRWTIAKAWLKRRLLDRCGA
jgi:RNA polymerase sigma-70 factor, ECF subfamily